MNTLHVYTLDDDFEPIVSFKLDCLLLPVEAYAEEFDKVVKDWESVHGYTVDSGGDETECNFSILDGPCEEMSKDRCSYILGGLFATLLMAAKFKEEAVLSKKAGYVPLKDLLPEQDYVEVTTPHSINPLLHDLDALQAHYEYENAQYPLKVNRYVLATRGELGKLLTALKAEKERLDEERGTFSNPNLGVPFTTDVSVSLPEEIKRLTKENNALKQEVNRWIRGEQVEGDYVPYEIDDTNNPTRP